MSIAPIRVLSLIPPMTQLNTPYPATAYLTGFLRAQGVAALQADLALALVLRLFSAEGLLAMREGALALSAAQRSASLNAFLDQFERHQSTLAPTLRFLQGRDSTLAHRIAAGGFLPEGPRFAALDAHPDDGIGDPLAWAFGALGVQDKARHLATLYLNDLADVVRDALDSRFEFVRYAESLASSQASFEPLATALAAPPSLLDRWLAELCTACVDQHRPQLVLLSVPFPGSVYGALRMAQAIKAHAPGVKIALGGGYANTELRALKEPRLFDLVDFVTLDAGERPLLALLEHLQGGRSQQRLVRTFVRNTADGVAGGLGGSFVGQSAPQADPAQAPSPSAAVQQAAVAQAGPGEVRYINWAEPDVPFEDVGTPTWDGLPLDQYLSLLDMLNPMHRLWSDGRWNKLTVAHGCYWKKCSFCDVGLDYIGRYETASASTLADRIERIVGETGQTGFHFVDEAAPPKALKALADELLRRRLAITWWGNIRFEKTFTPELADRLAESGCIAISGGLEVASDRLLALMKKGVSVEQVARVTKGFTDAGVLVHAYLMYGFPSQTLQDTVDALEYVRQLFEAGCIQSGFFHRFTCTVHSPVGKDPAAYGIRLLPQPPVSFAQNDVGFVDPTPMPPGVDHDLLGQGLRKAIYNYMHGLCVEDDVRRWFDHLPIKPPKPSVGRHRIAKALAQRA